MRLQPRDRRIDRGLCCLLQPGDAGDRHVIEEAARPLQHGRQARGIGGRRGEADLVDTDRAQCGAEFGVFLGRDVDADHAIDPGIARGLGEPCAATDRHRVGIAHQHQRHLRMARAEALGDSQDVGGARARCQAADIGGLDCGAIGHRIGERHAQFDHVRTAFDKGVEDGGGGVRRRIARGDEGDERGMAFGKGVGEAGHSESLRSTTRIRAGPTGCATCSSPSSTETPSPA
ncbi:hypothetical protein D9M73_104690 [compost metagenome]